MPHRTISMVAAILAAVGAMVGTVLAFFQSVDWGDVGKTWGPMGIGFVLFIILVWQGAKVAKTMLADTIADARRERDASRQLLREQATEFTAHIRQENEEFRSSLKDVVDAFERSRSKR